MKKIIGSLLCAAMLACSSTTPYTGTTSTTTTDQAGATVTTTESRALIANNVLAGTESSHRKLTAKVTGVNSTTREIALVTTNGTPGTIKAGPEVRNFAQIKKGDTVNIDYLTAVAFEVRPPTPAEVEQSKAAVAWYGRAAEGTKPAGMVGIGDLAVLTINSIDTTNQTVQLTGPGGTFNFKTKHPENLAYVKPGQTVVVKVAELLAANVTTTKAKS